MSPPDPAGAVQVRPFILARIQRKAKLPPGADLSRLDYIDAGYVDSMGLIKFLMEIETTFDIAITDDEIASPGFRTVDGVIALVEAKLHPPLDTAPLISIVIPAFNAREHLDRCLDSVLTQAGPAFEVLLIDDHSTDGTYAQAQAQARTDHRLRVAQTAAQGGPGIARNRGLERARGEWILFLDSDDTLAPDALPLLAAFLSQPANADCDAVGFDWQHADGAPDRGARQDQDALAAGKPALIDRYLRLQTDGSVIYTAMRRALIADNKLAFAHGYHEDVDFLFRVYWHARRVGFLDGILYVKHRQPGSIMARMSAAHIEGVLRAWRSIGQVLQDHAPDRTDWWRAHRVGAVGIIATRLRAIERLADPGSAAALHQALYAAWQSLLTLTGPIDLTAGRTQYFQLTHRFVAVMATGDVAAVPAALAEILRGSWSCTDLHHSVFLAPDQIRTCCKRFFVDGTMRGDVVLLDGHQATDITAERITTAKHDLHVAINRGAPTACDGCPFLEFRAWGPIRPTAIRYLSFEYHSVCNLECRYCSETYYGGAKATYDVAGLVEGFAAHGALDPQAVVVWGGGEPTIDAQFTRIIDGLATGFPNLTQRVLTNAVTHSATVERLLAGGRVAVTTSIDAGTPETFAKVRGRDRLARVIATLQRYAAANPARVTVKYIFTEGNTSLEECHAFAEVMQRAGLLGCNFQISHDFKQESVDRDVLLSIVALHGLLVRAGGRTVFVDDLLRQRLLGMDAAAAAAIRHQLAAIGVADALADAPPAPDLVVWGAGWQTRHLLERAAFFRQRKPAFLVDSTPSKIGGVFMGLDIRDPRSLQAGTQPVLIAAVQGYPAIYDAFLGLGLSPSRLVTGLVI